MADYSVAFSALKTVLESFAPPLSVKVDTPIEFALEGNAPSPFPQHKGSPLMFASVRLGKAYASFHLLPMYYELNNAISPALKKRMQGKTCFNFKHAPDPELLAELKTLTETVYRQWTAKKWL